MGTNNQKRLDKKDLEYELGKKSYIVVVTVAMWEH